MRKIFNLYIAIAVTLLFSLSATAKEFDVCESPASNLEMTECVRHELVLAQVELAKYLEASLEHNVDAPKLLESIKIAQKDWQDYLSSHCNSVYTKWREGSIAEMKELSCKTKLTTQRTHDIWADFLFDLDNALKNFPEPKR